ncbi:MAG: hypothetical protein IPJ69_11895 [Deltaproteobacteria bacterium]|nr:MAG: hypothetical protein IPJ69_11895 [Deltaproteobacteria bacterium]
MPEPTVQSGLPITLPQAQGALAAALMTLAGRAQVPTVPSGGAAYSTSITAFPRVGVNVNPARDSQPLEQAIQAAQLLTLLGAGDQEVVASTTALLMSGNLPEPLARVMRGIGVNPAMRMTVEALGNDQEPMGVRITGPLHAYGVSVSQAERPAPLVLRENLLGKGALLLVGVDPQQGPVTLTMGHEGPLAGALALTATHRHPLSDLTFEGILATYDSSKLDPVSEIVRYPASAVEIREVNIGSANATTRVSGILPVQLGQKGPVGTAIHVRRFS